MASTNKLEGEILQLLQDLRDDLEPATRLQKLNRLKVLGRDPVNSAPIFSKEAIETIAHNTIKENAKDDPSSLEALRCLANALLLHPPARQLLFDTGVVPKLIRRLAVDDSDGEFLCSRLLFLITYVDGVDFERLSLNYGLADAVNAALKRHASKLDGSKTSIEALNETLKLLFNITHFNPSLVASLLPSMASLTTMLHYYADPKRLLTPPLQPPIYHIVNALMNLLSRKGGNSNDNDANSKDNDANSKDNTSTNPFLQFSHLSGLSEFPETLTTTIDDLLILLAASLKTYPPTELDTPLTPLMLLLRAINALAPPNIRNHLRNTLLPTHADRALPLGSTDSVPSALLRLSTAPHAPGLREVVPELLFELCGGDATALVRAVGYGYASGFLVRRGISVPAEVERHAEVSGGDCNRGSSTQDVNYTTGQYRDQEEKQGWDTEPEMTEEEKEKEAERLFVLFERLRATGVVDVENPVAAAARSGHFEELNDNEGEN